MLHAFSRTEKVIGKAAMEKLAASKVAVFGIGGVGTFAVEGLIRAGLGKIVLVDDDCICLTNINRQIHATRKTIGKPKVEAMRDRILEINPEVEVTTYQKFYLPETENELIQPDYDYIIDAIDTVSGKIGLVMKAREMGIPIISSMGTGNKLDPTRLEISDISKTSVCPLARVMRKELRDRGITSLKVLYSREEPIKPEETENTREDTVRHQVPGSVSFVPSAAGLIIAGEVVKDLIREELGIRMNRDTTSRSLNHMERRKSDV